MMAELAQRIPLRHKLQETINDSGYEFLEAYS